jgi:hypothetical protein
MQITTSTRSSPVRVRDRKREVSAGTVGRWLELNSPTIGFALNTSVDHPGVQVTQPWGMNNNGEIVGRYADSQGMLYGFYAKATP